MDPLSIDLAQFLSDYGASNEWNITKTVAKRELVNDTPVLQYELHLQVCSTHCIVY